MFMNEQAASLPEFSLFSKRMNKEPCVMWKHPSLHFNHVFHAFPFIVDAYIKTLMHFKTTEVWVERDHFQCVSCVEWLLESFHNPNCSTDC